MDFDFSKIEGLEAEGYLTRRSHPSLDLFILNYTAKTQHDRYWTNETLQCRGLIFNYHSGTVVGRCLPKFFNYDELEQIPEQMEKLNRALIHKEPVVVQEKLDGSLIIVFSWMDEIVVASRGSFVSPQAQKAREILETKHSDFHPESGYTYLFEVLYPENRIVVDYGDREDLVLLTVIETETGIEVSTTDQDLMFPRPKEYPISTIEEAINYQPEDNAEGFVLRFPYSGFRVKLKWDEYKRLHRLLTGVTPRQIWQDLSEGKSLAPLLELVPDEYYKWVGTVAEGLRNKFDDIYFQAQRDFFIAKSRGFTERKEFALYFKECQCPPALFMLLDEKDPSPVIWKLIKPEVSIPFRCGQDI